MKRLASLTRFSALLFAFLILTAPLAVAQTMATALPGISVTGHGVASAPAETATIAIMLGSGDIYKDPTMMEEGASTPAASAEETAAPVVDALVGAGIPAEDIEVLRDPSSAYTSPYGSAMMVILRFTITEPTAERISELLETATATATEAELFVNMTSALYGVDDCATLRREARSGAIADAREQATVQAELLEVGLGEVTASRDDIYGAMVYSGMYPGAQVNSCTIDMAQESMASIYSAPMFDPSTEPVVTMTSSIELTFEIAPLEGATPAS